MPLFHTNALTVVVRTMRNNTNERCFSLLLGANQGLYKLWLPSKIDSALERIVGALRNHFNLRGH